MLNDDLFIFHNDSGVFVDHSNDLKDYVRDDTAITFVALEDALLIGLYKPFNQLYAELTTAQVTGASLTFEISDGASGWIALEVQDDTKDLTRSGFILFDRDNASWLKDIYNSKELFYIRITSDIDLTFTLRGLNILFADDNDLLSESPRIQKFYPKDETSFVKYHNAARNQIVQTLRNGGYAKKDTNVGSNSLFFTSQSFGRLPLKQISKFDILDGGEIREAAKHLALAKIYLDNSKNTDDKEYQKYNDSLDEFGNAFKLFYMSLDLDDDGETDVNTEQLITNDITVHKV